MADKGNYCLAILKVNEDYISLKTELKSLIDEMRDLSSMELQGKIINFVYYLGGDWKFLACVCGIYWCCKFNTCIYLVYM